MSRILVFPSSMSDALPFIEQARAFGATIVGASSMSYDPNASRCDCWVRLPRVDEAGFADRLRGVLAEHHLDRIFCPNNVAHDVIGTLIQDGAITAELIPSPFRGELARYESLAARADDALRLACGISDESRAILPSHVGAWLHYVDSVMGQSGEAKLAALVGAMASAPRGDVVEIGAYFGKSAAWLTLAATHLGVGPVLAIDPWKAAESVQHDAPAHVQRLAQGDYWDAVAQAFITNLLPIGKGHVNYLRMTATAALARYVSGSVTSPEFGTTTIRGEIALLHIDGNHDYEAVASDVALWAPKLAPGGWMVLDDYCWPHGDGPRRVGDAFLAERSEAIRQAFVVDGALFIRFGRDV